VRGIHVNVLAELSIQVRNELAGDDPDFPIGNEVGPIPQIDLCNEVLPKLRCRNLLVVLIPTHR
jgi:hypothetical protein